MKGYKNKIKQRIEDHCIVHFEKLNKDHMKLGNGLFNNRCHQNAIQQVKEGKFDTKIDLLNKHSNPLTRWFMRIDYNNIGI